MDDQSQQQEEEEHKRTKYPSKLTRGHLRRRDKTRKMGSKLKELLVDKSEGAKEGDNPTEKEKAPRLLMVRTVNHIHEPFDEKTQEIKVLLWFRSLALSLFFSS